MQPVDLNTMDYIRSFTVEWEPDFARAALVVVDMQYATGARDGALGRWLREQGKDVGDYRFERIENVVVPQIQRLLEAFRARNGAVIYLAVGAGRPDASDAPPHMRKLFVDLQNHQGSPEHEIIDALKPLAHEPVLHKSTVGAFASTGIDSLLRNLGREQLYLVGVSTNMCVDTTAREAADRGYAVALVDDACGATRPEYHEATLTNFRRLFGRVLPTAAVLEELKLG